MNIKGALKEAIKRWGKAARVADHKQPSSQERRAEAHKQLMRLRGLPDSERTKEIRKHMSDLTSIALYYRYSVGTIGGAGGFAWFSVRGHGDTWEEAFAHADKHRLVA
jgi:hypothetical protein